LSTNKSNRDLVKSKKKKLLQERADAKLQVRTPAAEQLLIKEIPAINEARILCTSLGRGQFAQMTASYFPQAQVVCQFFDTYLADEARQHLGIATGDIATGGIPAGEAGQGGAADGKPLVVCAADFPDGPFDLVVIPIDPRGDSELARDLLQSGHERLAAGGRMLSATSNDEDQWLHDEMRKLFDKVTRRPLDEGVLYLATKTAGLKKHKNFECEFAFRDQERLIKAVSRPGVFSHRSLDGGARALMNTMVVRDGDRVLDLGCGSGVVAFAAAFRAERVAVVAVDSHARAVECTAKGAALNGLENVTSILNADGEVPEPGTYDLVLGNPPYYSDYRIAEVFLQGARRALKPGGKVLIVAKSYAWYETRMPELFDDMKLHEHKQYTVVEGTQRAG
jgi:16S rRNA (guanine1207-N2)-methyltransferase